MVGFSFDVGEFDTKIFQEEAPLQHTLGVHSVEGVVLVVGANCDARASTQHGAKSLEGLHCGQKFFLANSAVPLCCIQFSGMESNGSFILKNGSTQLQVAGVHMNVEWFVVIGKS